MPAIRASGWLCPIIAGVASGLEQGSNSSSRLAALLAEGEHERLEFKQAMPKIWLTTSLAWRTLLAARYCTMLMLLKA